MTTQTTPYEAGDFITVSITAEEAEVLNKNEKILAKEIRQNDILLHDKACEIAES